MEKPEKENITRRLIFSFCLLIIISIFFGIYSLYSIRTISSLARTIYNHPLVVSNAALQANVSITKMHRNMKDIVLLKSSDRIEQSIAEVNQQEQLVYQYLDIVRDKILGEEGRSLEKESRTLFRDWRLIREEVIALVHDGQRDKAAEITIGKGADHVAKLEEKMIALTGYARTKASSLISETEKVQSKLYVTTIIFLILWMTMSFMIAFFTVKRTASTEKKLTESRQLLVSAMETARMDQIFEDIVKTIREPLLVLNHDLKVISVSRSFYDFFKVTPEETVGQLIYDLGSKQWDIPKLRELLETILPEKTSFDNYEVEHDFADIGRRVMLLNARQIQRVLGKERIILLAIEDITERKKIETGLKKAHEELESFAYSVSHDLRSPLRGIDGWSLALLEDYKDKLGEQGREYIDLVRSETQIMGRLIDDLLMFSRQNRAELNQRPLDMTAMAQAIITRLQQQNPTLQTDFIVQPGLKALGDNNLIEIALKNLLDNAEKFSSKNAHGRIEFGQVEKEGGKAFFVRDNGVGFDMAYSKKLFGVFRRLHKASEFPGTGIGLASVQRIINRHGGHIWAEAKVNEGATFYFTLEEGI